MKKEKILKIVVTLMMTIMLLVMATNVFAVDSDAGIDLMPFEDQTNQLTPSNTNNTNTNNANTNNANTNTNVNTNNNINKVTNTANANNYNTNLPKAGLVEDSMLAIGITVLVILAIFTYKKLNQYKNI